MAWAIVRVPFSNAGNSNTPTGPFQTMVPARASCAASRVAVSGPMSRIRSSGATSVAAFTVAGASAAKALAVTTSVGIGTCAPRAVMAAITARASSSNAGSARLLPMGRPAANMKVLAMPPPTMSWSTLSARLLRMVSLVDTLEPATMATSGRCGCARAWVSASISADSKGPAQAMGAYCAMPYVVPSARWAVPKASFTKMSHSAASLRANASWFFFSPTLRRQFSSSTTWPGATVTPSTQSDTSGTSRPSSSARRAATGASESSGLNAPSVGRPRWLVTITAAPASSAIWMQGMEARMRVSSVMRPASSCGTLRSARMKTRWPWALPWAHRSEKRRMFMGWGLPAGARGSGPSF